MTTVAVIIPYFQKEQGILRRALSSVLAQRLSPDVRLDVIVVDDGSPAPVQTEIEDLPFTPPFYLTVVEQPNGGVAAARNTGLRHADKETTYIAFLDSDDIWDPGHLAKALSTLENKADYYFCNHRRNGHHDSYFASIHFENFLAKDAQPVGDDVYEVNRDAFFKFFLRTFVSQISTVVYRRSVAPDATFNASLQAAGEDHLFLLQLVTKSRHIRCSSHVWVTCGEGVNIYYSRYGWGDPGHLIRHMGIILALYRFHKNLSLTQDDERYLVGRIWFFRKAFAFLTVRYFIKMREFWPPELVRMTRGDPRFWRWYPLCILYVALCYPLRLYAPSLKG